MSSTNQTSALSSRCLFAVPPHSNSSPLPRPHWAVTFPAHCLCRRDGTIKQEVLPEGAADCGWIWSSEESVDRNGQNRSPTPAMHMSQAQPDVARWKEATEATGLQVESRDTDHWLGTPIIVQPQPYWISPGNVFLSLPRCEVALLLISLLFIKGAPEESKRTVRTECGLVVEGRAVT